MVLAWVNLHCFILLASTQARAVLQRFVVDHKAETMQAVPTMLELVPLGVNKGSGMRKLLANLELPVQVKAQTCTTFGASL